MLLQNDPYSEPEVDLEYPLQRGYAAAKQTTVYSSPLVPMEVGTGSFQHRAKQSRNPTDPFLAPRKQEIGHGDDNAAHPRRSERLVSSQYQPLHEEAISQLPPKGKPLRARGPEDMVSSQPPHGQPLRAGGQEGFEPRPQPCQGNEFMPPYDPMNSTEEHMPPLQSDLNQVSRRKPQATPTKLSVNLTRPPLCDEPQTPGSQKTHSFSPKHAPTIRSVDAQTSMDFGNQQLQENKHVCVYK